MSYQALYRKYRSQNFDELVGQNAIKQTLLNSLRAGKISHAYLFSGPRGTGKTSVARLFAKALNCEHGVGEICNGCFSCNSITEGNHPDVIEIDAASNSGVDEVRNLIEAVKYGPIKSKYKVYIIDEVHMMTTNAFNALLKTLEEPPSYCVFILCTTEPYKLLPTILSRCQRYDFKKISDEDLKTLLNSVLSKENVTCSPEALDVIVELANGGARDSLSLLDQIISYCGSKIEKQDIFRMFGLTTASEKQTLIYNVKKNNTLEVIHILDNYRQRNIDLNRFVDEVLIILKDALVYSKTRDKNLITCNEPEVAKDFTYNISDDELLYFIETFIKCQNEFKTTSNTSFLFEVYLLKMMEYFKTKGTVQSAPSPQFKQVQPQPVKPQQTFVQPQPRVEQTQVYEAPRQVEQPRPQPQPVQESRPVPQMSFAIRTKDSEMAKFDTDGITYTVPEETLINIVLLNKKEELKLLRERWSSLEQLLVNENEGPYASALLHDSSPFLLTENNLILICDFAKPAAKLNIQNNQPGLRKIVKKLLGRQVAIYAINRDEYTQLVGRYQSLREFNKLPKKAEIIDERLF